jgi:hypothetical protein
VILAEKKTCEDSDDEDQEEPNMTTIGRAWFPDLNPKDVEDESQEALPQSDQMKARLINSLFGL